MAVIIMSIEIRLICCTVMVRCCKISMIAVKNHLVWFNVISDLIVKVFVCILPMIRVQIPSTHPRIAVIVWSPLIERNPHWIDPQTSIWIWTEMVLHVHSLSVFYLLLWTNELLLSQLLYWKSYMQTKQKVFLFIPLFKFIRFFHFQSISLIFYYWFKMNKTQFQLLYQPYRFVLQSLF